MEETIELHDTRTKLNKKINQYGFFNIDLTQEIEDYEKISIYNILGENVYTLSIVPKENNLINLSQLSNGYYIARLDSNTKQKTLKLIKN